MRGATLDASHTNGQHGNEQAGCSEEALSSQFRAQVEMQALKYISFDGERVEAVMEAMPSLQFGTNEQHATCNISYKTCIMHHASCIMQPASCIAQHTTFIMAARMTQHA
jgi:hypothetical protein